MKMDKWLAVGSAVVGLLVVGCGGPVESPASENGQPQSETAAPGEVTANGCGDYGWWKCPGTTQTFLYFACASEETGPSRAEAAAFCDEYCSAICVDNGWIRG
ncbi:hypothetical protein ACLESD_08255 [Pyxidicoccus sp. 3LFB2]